MYPDNSEENRLDPSGRNGEGFSDPISEFDSMGFELIESVDSLTWQRMVEDRLSDDQYRELLLAMEANPALWRECALAFLEEQALKKSFAGLRCCPKSARPGAQGISPPTDPVHVASTQVLSKDGDSTVVDQRSKGAAEIGTGWGKVHWQVVVPILAVAAGVVFSFSAFNEIWREMPVDDLEANSVPIMMDRESFRDYLAELSAEQRHDLFERSAEQTVGLPIQAQPVSLSPGRAGGQRRFLFYRTPDGRQIIVPVDDYQYVTHDFQ